MTKDEAITIRSRFLQGESVPALDLQEAVREIRMAVARDSKHRYIDRFHLPPLSPIVKERCNALLCFNLGKALRA